MSILVNQVGIHIAEEKIQLVEISNKNNCFNLENVDEEYFDEILVSASKEAKFIHILQNAFNEIILRKPLNSSKVSISLPLSYFKIIEIPIDKNLSEKDLNDYINWELSKLYPDKKNNSFSIQKVILDSFGYISFNRVLVYLISIDLLKRIHKFCVRNNLQLKSIDNSHIATTSLIINRNSEKLKLSLFLENNKASVLLFNDGKLIFEKNSSYSNISMIPTFISKILEDFRKSELDISTITKLYISGNGVSNELKKSIETSTNLSSEIIFPFSKLKINPDLEENNFVKKSSSKFSSAAGMAFRLLS